MEAAAISGMTDTPFDQLIPVRRHPFEEEPTGRITVLVPKFTTRFTRRWIAPLFARPDVRLHLDDVGSAVWRRCDGRTTVRRIAEQVGAETGGGETETLERVIRFLRHLARADSVSFLAPVRDDTAPGHAS